MVARGKNRERTRGGSLQSTCPLGPQFSGPAVSMSFLQGRIQGLRSLHAFVAALALLASYYTTLIFHPKTHFAPHAFWQYLAFYPALILLGHFFFCASGNGNEKAYHEIFRRFRRSRGLWLASQEIAVIGLTLLVGIVLTKDIVVSRSFLLVLFPVLWLSLIISVFMLQEFGVPRLFGGRHRLRTLLVADITSHDPLIDWLQAYNALGLQLSWVRSSRPLPPAYAHLDPNLPHSSPEDLIAKLQPSVVVCSDGSYSLAELARMRQVCDEYGIRFTVHLDHVSGLGSSATVYNDSGHSFAVFRHEPLESPFGRILKRIFDLAVALPVAVFILPLLTVLVKILHWLQSPGPLLYTQERGGAGQHTFRVYKFRTMHMNHGRDGDQATPEDERVFPAGRWMRKFSIDEFPQFLNVLRGDMSVVGPRPHYVDHDAKFADIDPLYRFRKWLKPGVTGLAQIEGFRGETRTRAEVRVRSYTDIAYLENWSIFLDFFIVLKTVWQLVRPPKGAV